MSVTMPRADDDVIKLTLAIDPDSPCPPLCQLCYNPVCFSVSEHLRRIQRTSQSLLGTLHIVVGLLNICLGAAITVLSSPYNYWLGAMFVLFGIVGILSEKFPSPCLVILNVILNLTGVGFAIAANILYSIDMALIQLWWMCEDDYIYRRGYIPSPQEEMIKRKCLEGRELILMMVKSVILVLIVLSILEFCVVISSAVLGIKALKRREKTGNKSTEDPHTYKPLQDEVTTNPTV